MEHQDRFDRLERTVADLAVTVTTLVEGFAAMSDQSQELATDVAALVAAVGSLTASISDIDAQLTTIGTEVATLQAAIAANHPLDLGPLETAIADAQALVATAQAADTQAKADAAAGAPPAPPAPPVVVPVADPATGLPLYVHDPTDPNPVTVEWTAVTDVTGGSGETLYTFSGDTAGGPATGVSQFWTLFQGTPVPTA
jgi:uncharacterized protein YoxC